MDQQCKLILLRGNSGSGKTTVAKALQLCLPRGTLLLSQDVVRREMLRVRDESGTQAIGLLTDLVQYGRSNCPFVILEGILCADWYQPLFRCIREEFHKHVYAYYFDIPFEETLRRHETKPNAHEFGEPKLRQWWREKDYLATISETPITKGLSTDDTVSMILTDIGYR